MCVDAAQLSQMFIAAQYGPHNSAHQCVPPPITDSEVLLAQFSANRLMLPQRRSLSSAYRRFLSQLNNSHTFTLSQKTRMRKITVRLKLGSSAINTALVIVFSALCVTQLLIQTCSRISDLSLVVMLCNMCAMLCSVCNAL